MPHLTAAIELPGRGGTVPERLALAEAGVAEARARGAELAVLPEAYLPGYSHARAYAGHDARTWMEEAARRHGVTIAMGYVDGDACLLGVTTPDGRHVAYQKRFLTPDEARVWRPGAEPVIAETPAGRVGLLLCADVLHLDAWEGYVGRVDAVLVAAAWPDYRGRVTSWAARPVVRWLARESTPYRRDLLARAATAVGASVVFADACGPWEGEEGFAGGSCVYGADGTVLAEGAIAVAPIGRAPPGKPLRHPARWAAFLRVYQGAAGIRGLVARR